MTEEKEVQLVKIDAAEFGLKAENVEGVEQAFMPAINDRNILEGEYKKIVAMDISDPEAGLQARNIRLKLVKVRTSIAAIHKSQKAFFLASGKFVDAWKNKETEPVTQMEKRLTEIEKHQENLEKERIETLRIDREATLAPFTDTLPPNLGEMDQELFDGFLRGVKIAHQEKIEAEAKAKEEAEAKIKAEKEEKERKEKIAAKEREEQRLENERLMKKIAEQDEEKRKAKAKQDEIDATRKKKENALKLKLENERREAEKLQAIALKKERVAKEKKEAELKVAREQAEKLKQEKKIAEEKKLQEEKEAEERAADVKNRTTKNNEAKDCFIALGMTEELAIMAVKAIAKGSINNVSINY